MSIKGLLVEDYRPATVQDLILPKEIKDRLQQFVDEGSYPHLLLSGTAGTGKTSAALALTSQLGCSVLRINGSKDSGIDVLRTTIQDFASTVSLLNKDAKKVVIIDEADFMNQNSLQPALRGFIEEFEANCRFIFTCNYRNRIMDAIQSRCSVIEFTIPESQRPAMATQMYKRTLEILGSNDVEYDPKAVQALVKKFFPDFRRILNELQSYAASGKIDIGILTNVAGARVADLVQMLKAKNFKDCRAWIDENANIDQVEVFSKLYDDLADIVQPKSQPELILILDTFISKAPMAANPKINLAAACIHMMSSVEWK